MRHDPGAGFTPSAIALLPAPCLLSLLPYHSNRIGPRSPWSTCSRLPNSGRTDQLLDGLEQRIETKRLEEVTVATPDHPLRFRLLQELLRSRNQNHWNIARCRLPSQLSQQVPPGHLAVDQIDNQQ